MSEVRTAGELYAHAIAIETEAAACYTALARRMDGEGRAALADAFHWLAGEEAAHLDALRRRTAGLALPQVDAQRYSWLHHSSSDGAAHELVYRLMTPRIALAVALHAERRAQAFYHRVGSQAADPAVRTLAKEMEEEERRHASLVAVLLESTPSEALEPNAPLAR